MDRILKKHQKEIENSILDINRYSMKNSKINLRNLVIISVFISIVILKVTRSYMINLPDIAFYILVIGILIASFIVPIIKSKVLYKKCTRMIDKNIKNIYENLNSLYDEYEENLMKKINSINSNIKISSLSASTYMKDDELIEYELNQHIFQGKENKINKEIYLDNEEKVKYLEDAILLIEEFQNTEMYKYFETISSGNLITQYLPDCDYKKTMDNINQVFKIMDNYYNRRKQLLVDIKKPLDLGLDGEKIVDEYLNIYEDEIINLSNIRLEVDGNSIENDNILITRKGIFILEVKNIGSTGSYSILVESDGRWIKEFNNKSTEVINFNATEQNDRHIAILQKFINNKLNRSIQKNNYLKAEGIVVIANNTLDIKNESMQNIYRISEVYRYINKFDDVLTYEEMLEIKEIILKENLKPKKYPILDYKSEIKNNTRIFYNLITNLSNEKENLCNIYTYLNDIGYIKCCYWLINSNILRKFKSSKFKDILMMKNITEDFLESIGAQLNNDNIKIDNIDITINKEKPKIRGILTIVIAVITAIVTMNLLYIPGKLTTDRSGLYSGKYGYVDEKGKLVIGHKYDSASSFSKHGLARVGNDERYGIIDKTGKIIVKLKYNYSDIQLFNSGLIGVYEEGTWTILNKIGKKVTNKKYSYIRSFAQGLIFISIDNKVGCIDSKGNEVIKPIYDELEYMKDGLFAVSKEGKYGLIDKTGKEILPFEYQMISIRNGGSYIRLQKDNKYGILDPKTQKIVSEIKYQKLEHYGNRIRVKFNGKYGFLSTKTYKELLKPTYDEIEEYINEVAKVKLNNKWGLINDKYELVVPTEYDEITELGRGWLVKLNNKFGVVNDKYELVVPIEYDEMIPTYDTEEVWLIKNGQSYFININ